MNKDKFLHISLSFLLAFAEWLFDTYGDKARGWVIDAIQRRYGLDVTYLVNAVYSAGREWEQSQKAGGS